MEFAIWRADHNGLMRTAKVVGWDNELFSHEAERNSGHNLLRLTSTGP